MVYRTADSPPILGTSNLNDQQALCTVCHTDSRGEMVMIPGTVECPASWTREYYGYIMSSHHNEESRASYECVDMDAEGVGTSDNGHGLFYVAEIRCGSLPCGTYGRDNELVCVVCTK